MEVISPRHSSPMSMWRCSNLCLKLAKTGFHELDRRTTYSAKRASSLKVTSIGFSFEGKEAEVC